MMTPEQFNRLAARITQSEDPVLNSRVAGAFAAMQRETAEKCAGIERCGETLGMQLTGIGIEKDIKKEFGL